MRACTSSSVVQFFAVAAPPASAPTVKRAVDQPPDPTLELRCDAHRCLPPPPQQQLVTARTSVFCWPCSPFASGGITAAAWHVDTTFFASADANGTVVLWKKKAAVPGHRKRPSFDLGRMPSVDKK